MKRISLWFLCSMMLLILLAGCQPAELQPAPDTSVEPGAAETATVEPSPAVEPSGTATVPVESTPTVADEGDEAATATLEPLGESETAESPELETLVRQDLAERLGIVPQEIEVVSKEAVEWPNGALGCPAPGVMYTQAIVPGYRMVLEVDGERYEYHTDRQQRFLLCEGGEPRFPTIPIDPGDIDDGEPWVPVDPPPPTGETP